MNIVKHLCQFHTNWNNLRTIIFLIFSIIIIDSHENQCSENSNRDGCMSLLSLHKAKELEKDGRFLHALEIYQDILSSSSLSSNADITKKNANERIDILNAAASVSRKLKKHNLSYSYHTEVMQLKGTTGATALSYLLSYTDLATDLYLNFDFAEAITLLRSTLHRLDKMLTPQARAILLKFIATVSDCQGNYVTAIENMNIGRQMAENEDKLQHLNEVSQHRLLLIRAVSSIDEKRGAINQFKLSERIKLIEMAEKLSVYLMRVGPWQSILQMPIHYNQALSSIPWLQINTFPKLHHIEDILIKHYLALREEYLDLKTSHLLLRDSDCIADADGGRWWRYEITGAWYPLDKNRCSNHTPVACHTLQLLRDTNFRILRAGYSAIEPNTWIRPHFGRTNEQLKLHLGLIVPKKMNIKYSKSKKRKRKRNVKKNGILRKKRNKKINNKYVHDDTCTTFRVGNETRTWHVGKIILFDDSFEHEVYNHCTEERVVFQVVIGHPQLVMHLNSEKHTYPVVIDNY